MDPYSPDERFNAPWNIAISPERYSPSVAGDDELPQRTSNNPERTVRHTLPEAVGHDLPEVVPHTSPQVMHQSTLEAYKPDKESETYALAYTPVQHSKVPFEEVVAIPDPLPSAVKLPCWRRWRIGLFVGVATIIIVAVVLGAVFGTGTVGTATSNPLQGSPTVPSPTTTPADKAPSDTSKSIPRGTACGDTLCPQILSTAVLGGSNTPQELFIFARGKDNGIWYNSAPVDSLGASVWPSNRQWNAVKGGPFLTQPTAQAWGEGGNVSVAAVSGRTSRVTLTSFTRQGYAGFVVRDSEDIGGPVNGPLASCALRGNIRSDWYVTEGKGVLQNVWNGTGWTHSPSSDQSQWNFLDIGFTFRLASRPAVVCRNDATWFHDIVVYGIDGAVRHTMYKYAAPNWISPINLGGTFQGEPVLINVGSNRIHFFGVGQDGAMYHFGYNSDTQSYTALLSLGGSFQSVPSVVATANGNRLDIVALGTNDRVQHIALSEATGASLSGWEDLDVVGLSAPIAVKIGNGDPEKVRLFVVAAGGGINQTVATVESGNVSWKNVTWESMGGNVTTEFYRG